MRLIFLPSLIGPVREGACFGGAEMAALALAEALAEKGHRVTLIGTRGTGGVGLRTWIVPRGTPILGPVDPQAPKDAPAAPDRDRVEETPPLASGPRPSRFDDEASRAKAPGPEPFPEIFERISVHARAGGFDALHLHLIDASALRLAHDFANAHPGILVVSTLHVAAVFPETAAVVEHILRSGTRLRFTAPSAFAARSYGPDGHRISVIPNGVDVDGIEPVRDPPQDRRLAWAGRRSPEKGLTAALEIARIAGRPITIAGPGDRAPPTSWPHDRAPPTSWPHVEDVGFVPRREVPRILGRAEATLVTSSIPEAHSLVAVESLAAGTPVVAFRRGALGEVIEDGVTGFLVDPDELLQATDAVDRVRSISRSRVRRAAEERFRHGAVVERFEALYRGEASASAREI